MWRHPLLLLGLLLVVSRAGSAQAEDCRWPQPRHPLPFSAQERLDYRVTVVPTATDRLGLTGLRAARATLWVGRNTGDALQLHASGKSTAVASAPPKFFGDLTSHLDPQTLQPQRVSAVGGGDGERWHTHVTFGAGTGALTAPDWEAFHHDGDVADVLGAVYRLRAIALAAGDSLCVDVAGARRRWRVRFTVLPLVTVATPWGDVPALHLAGTARDEDASGVSGAFDAYYSADARRLPLSFVARGGWATVRAELTSVTTPGQRDPHRPSEHAFP